MPSGCLPSSHFPFETRACFAGASDGVPLLLVLWKRRGQKREVLTSDAPRQQGWDCSLSRLLCDMKPRALVGHVTPVC